MARRKLTEEQMQKLMARMQDEAQGTDPDALDRFMAEHDGMTPLEFALSQHPAAAESVAKAWPHLVAKRPKR